MSVEASRIANVRVEKRAISNTAQETTVIAATTPLLVTVAHPS